MVSACFVWEQEPTDREEFFRAELFVITHIPSNVVGRRYHVVGPTNNRVVGLLYDTPYTVSIGGLHAYRGGRLGPRDAH